MNIPYVFKRCSKCGQWLVASSVNFYKIKGGKYGFKSICKECDKKCHKEYCKANKEAIKEYQREYNKKYQQANKEAIAEYKRQYYEANKEAEAERHKKYYEANKEAILEQNKKYYEANKEAIAEYKKKWYEANKEAKSEYDKKYRQTHKQAKAEYHKKYREQNKETLAEKRKKYYEANKEAILECCKKYRETHKQARAEYDKKYKQTPQGQVVRFNSRNRRRAREQNQGNGITPEQWLEMMSFFEFRCAYSGKYIGGDSKDRTIDHIEPLNNGGENEIWNCVPMDKSLNSSKKDKEMLEWYIKQPFCTAERLLKIYKWQEYAFNKWGTIGAEA